MDTRYPISRAGARAAGLKRYFTGEPCVHGHIDERMVSTGHCMECSRIRCRSWAKKDVEGNRRRSRKWAESLTDEQREARREYNRAYYQSNRETIVERSIAWYRNNPERHYFQTRKRKRMIREMDRRLTAEEWREIKARYDHRCLKCGGQEPEITLTVDHVIPLSKGGTDSPDNIQPLCGSCNCAKYVSTTDYREVRDGLA